MRYIVYIDRLFILQAVQTFVLLLLTGTFLRGDMPSGAGQAVRIVLGSGVEAFFFCAVFLFPGIGGGIKNLLFAAGSLSLLAVVFRIHTPEVFLRAVVLFHGAAFLLGGILHALSGMTGESLAGHTLRSALCAAASGVLISLLWNRERERRQRMFATVELLEGKIRIVTVALIDSGNSLYDPVSERPVCVVERSVLEGRIPLNRPEKFRLVPYRTLAGRSLMQAIEIEKMKVKREGQEILVERALLGLYDGKVTREGAYRMILHPALLRGGRP